MINSFNFAHHLRTAREKAKKSVKEMAKSLGISVAAYHDLESFDDEFIDCISLQQIAILGKLLHLDLRTFFPRSGEALQKVVSLEDLANTIKDFLNIHHITIQEFQERAGWEGISQCLENPLEFLKYNMTALADICEIVGVNWLSVISGINNLPPQSQ